MVARKDSRIPERYPEFIGGKAAAVVALLILWAFNFVWYSGFTSRTLMGDDLYRWLAFRGQRVLPGIIAPTGDKYRPFLDLFQFPLFKVFSANYQAWVLFNTLLNCVVIGVLFLLVRRLTRGDSLIAFAAAFIYITSRFAFYQVLQVSGQMEALGLLFMLLILHAALSYLQKPRIGPALAIAGLFFLAIFTNERYVVLLPFILLVFWLAEAPEGLPKWGLLLLGVAPFAIDFFLKKVAFGMHYFVGVEDRPIALIPLRLATFTKNALLNIVWLNVGDQSQVGISGRHIPAGWLLVIFTIVGVVAVTGFLGLRSIRLEDADERRAEARGAVLWAVLFGSLVISSAATIRQELRLFTAGYVVFIVYYFYLYSKVRLRRLAKYGVLALLVVLILSTDLFYRSHLRDVYFVYSQQIADSAHDVTYGVYGSKIKDYAIYVDNQAGLDWILADGDFLAPYVGTDYDKAHLVRNADDAPFGELDRNKTLFLRLDWPSRTLVNITNDVLASHPATVSVPSTLPPTPPGGVPPAPSLQPQ